MDPIHFMLFVNTVAILAVIALAAMAVSDWLD